MFCISCGKELEEGASFCPFCGTPVPGKAGDTATAPVIGDEDATRVIPPDADVTHRMNPEDAEPTRQMNPQDAEPTRRMDQAMPDVTTQMPAGSMAGGNASAQPQYWKDEHPQQQSEEPKKGSTGLIIAIIVLVVVLIGGAAVITHQLGIWGDDAAVTPSSSSSSTSSSASSSSSSSSSATPKVPNVVGMSQDEAVAALQGAGFTTDVQWAESDRVYPTVVSTTPAADIATAKGSKVVVYIASPGPRDAYHLADYMNCTPENLSKYLSWKGYSLTAGTTTANYAETVWSAGSTTVITTPQPFSHHHGMFGGGTPVDELSKGLPVGGIRLSTTGDLFLGGIPAVNLDSAQAYMDACGFSNMTDYVTQDTIVLPTGYRANSADSFIYASGIDGDYYWGVEIRYRASTSVTEVVLIYMPQSGLGNIDLSSYGNSTSSYFAYVDNFTE